MIKKVKTDKYGIPLDYIDRIIVKECGLEIVFGDEWDSEMPHSSVYAKILNCLSQRQQIFVPAYNLANAIEKIVIRERKSVCCNEIETSFLRREIGCLLAVVTNKWTDVSYVPSQAMRNLIVENKLYCLSLCEIDILKKRNDDT